jgi:hypothetical protein
MADLDVGNAGIQAGEAVAKGTTVEAAGFDGP